jgi:hypothetical protein
VDAPQNPAGAYVAEEPISLDRRKELISIIESAPRLLRSAVAGLSEQQLDTKYRNWTIRQIVHHLADSHVNSYIRFKWALTEDHPTIKAYDETKWSDLQDSRTGDVRVPLALFEALHAKWVMLLRSMTDAQFERSFFHPESRKTVSLSAALSQYAWHCRHHTGQINWLREKHGW